MPDTHLFLSDAHFGAFSDELNREIEEDLISLIAYCRDDGIRLHILGDLFDYWMEYPGHHPKYGDRILDSFRRYMSEMGPVLYITGNHDNWTRGYLSEVGFDVESEYRILYLRDKKVFLHHGDGLDEPGLNLPRPGYHRLLRNRKFVKFYQTCLPPARGLKMMKLFSDLSRSGPVAGPKRLDSWAGEYLGKSDTDFVICGHDHIPRIETFQSGIYLNCGPFHSQRTAVEYTNGEFRLVVWDRAENQLKEKPAMENISNAFEKPKR